MSLEEFERQNERIVEAPKGFTVEDARQRKIIHIDMDAFYASVEQRDNPDLRGKPVAVGGSRERGVVAAASYEARQFGVHSAMPSVTAKRKCPELVFVAPRFDVYKAVSRQVRAIFAEYTALIEPLSLDEAYLDVTENLKNIASATEIAEQIRARIRSETGLTASAGVSYNKFLAKMASGQRKPDGLFVILPRMGAAFVEALPVGKFHGIGPATAPGWSGSAFGSAAISRPRHWNSSSSTSVRPGLITTGLRAASTSGRSVADRVRKSIGAENTFAADLFTVEEARAALKPLVEKVWRHCEATTIRGRTVTLKAKYADFRQITRSWTGGACFTSQAAVEEVLDALLEPLFPVRQGIRLLGVTLSSLGDETAGRERQLRLSI